MRPLLLFFAFFSLASLTGCQRASAPSPPAAARVAAESASAPSARRVVRKASISLRVADPDAARRRAVELTRERGGFVESSTLDRGANDPLEREELTLRVPSDQLDGLLLALRSVSRQVLSERTSSADVTDAAIDVAARLSGKRKLEERLQRLLGDTHSVKDALEVERELGTVQSDIEVLEAKKAVMDKQIALATLELSLVREPARVVTHFADLGQAFERARVDALNVGGGLLLFGVRALGVLVPLLLLVGVPLGGLVWLIRRVRARSAATHA